VGLDVAVGVRVGALVGPGAEVAVGIGEAVSVKKASTLMRAVLVSEAGGLPLSVQTKATLKTWPAWSTLVGCR
jgi:hypothetical protein